MPYAEPYVYLRLLGTLGNNGTGIDSWGVGIKLRHPGAAPSIASLSAFLETISVPTSTFHAGTVGAGTTTFLKELTAAFIGTDGKYVGGGTQQTTRRAYGSPVAGTGTADKPYSQACVISLRTLVQRGPGSNGRIYYPACSLTITPNSGVLVAATQTAIADQAKTWIDQVNAAADSILTGSGGVSVMSAVGAGVAATVTAIRVGNRLDRQERRENAITETYQLRSVASIGALVQNRDEVAIGQPFEV